MRASAQHARADRVKRPHPHALQRTAEEALDSIAHLAGSLVREGDGENLPRLDAVDFDQPRDASREYARFARTRSREHEEWAVMMQDRFALGGIEAAKQRVITESCRRCSHYRSITSNVAPRSALASTNFPRWFSSTMRRASERPMPHPLCFVEKPGSK